MIIGVGGGGWGERPPPHGLEKFQGKLCFQSKRKLLKNPEWKKYTQYSEKCQGHSVFQSKRKLLKNPECEKYIQYSEKFQGKLCFQSKHKLLKNPEWKKYVQYSKNFQGHSVFFRASASCSKILNVKSIFNSVKNVRTHSVFQDKCKLLKNPE